MVIATLVPGLILAMAKLTLIPLYICLGMILGPVIFVAVPIFIYGL